MAGMNNLEDSKYECGHCGKKVREKWPSCPYCGLEFDGNIHYDKESGASLMGIPPDASKEHIIKYRERK
jgi:predicted amidophosphoribosyltransferase